ncbi:unnamed protein product [Colletotrichum noveboracense]|uniref:Uncharacterized protein n=1 Tax=Colletotrichum noveboracense TaxID=2664923 RepID=A0A9W4S6F7_9PEZI|nr:unnamed protein product [Colletotrichum noveboracense]
MDYQFLNQNEPRCPHQDSFSNTKHTNTSNVNTTNCQGAKEKEVEDRMSRYFGSDLPWSHVDVMSRSQGSSSQESTKKD